MLFETKKSTFLLSYFCITIGVLVLPFIIFNFPTENPDDGALYIVFGILLVGFCWILPFFGLRHRKEIERRGKKWIVHLPAFKFKYEITSQVASVYITYNISAPPEVENYHSVSIKLSSGKQHTFSSNQIRKFDRLVKLLKKDYKGKIWQRDGMYEKFKFLG